ncbi:hypothetical protein QOT17_001654 [Balamuthia mandrillaris]
MGISYYIRVVASVSLHKDQVEGFDGDSSTDLASWLASRCGSEVVCVLRGEGGAYDDFFETIDFVVASGGEPPSPKRGRTESDSKEEEEYVEDKREYYDDQDGTAHLRSLMKYAEDNADDPGFWRDNATVILEDNTKESYKGKRTMDHVEVGPFTNYCFPVRSVEVDTLMWAAV